MRLPAVEAEEALQVLVAHDLDLLLAADPATKDSPYARLRVSSMLSYVHRAFTRKEKAICYLERFCSMQVRQLGYIRFLVS